MSVEGFFLFSVSLCVNFFSVFLQLYSFLLSLIRYLLNVVWSKSKFASIFVQSIVLFLSLIFLSRFLNDSHIFQIPALSFLHNLINFGCYFEIEGSQTKVSNCIRCMNKSILRICLALQFFLIKKYQLNFKLFRSQCIPELRFAYSSHLFCIFSLYSPSLREKILDLFPPNRGT